MRLTSRQAEYLRLLRDGNTYEQVGQILGIKAGAVSAGVLRAQRKNGYSSATQLRKAVRYASLTIGKQKRRIAGISQTKAQTWRVLLSAGKNRNRYIGTYRTYEQAVTARLEAEKKYRGTDTH